MASNTILVENQKQGTPKSVWDAPASDQIEGFASEFSVDNGSAVSFKINLNVAQNTTAPYHIEIYRLGYYGGDGATLVTTIDNLTGIAQPDPITDARGLVDAGNWTVSATWQTPETAVSGVYLAKLVRDDNGATNQIPFVVRDDQRSADIVLQTSDTTWQAYNGWGGRNGEVGGNLYGGFDQPDYLSADAIADCTGSCVGCTCSYDRAFAVSYNRPFIVRDGGGAYAGGQDYLFGADYSAIYFLEKNGYDISYISGVDSDRLGASYLQKYKAFISVGHDEYWSGDQRANVEAARDAGVNLLFWSGNEVYWKTRWETSIVDGTEHRTLVTYKETRFNAALGAGPSDYANVDPSNEWTGTWRDTRFEGNPGAVGARPENSLTGQLFVSDGTGEFGGALDVPAAFAGLRVWRDTGVGPTGATGIAPGIIGYEWDISPEDAYRPAGLIKLSETNIPWSAILVDQGNRLESGVETHNLSLYRDDSGALVFGAGTVFWSWGLSDQHDSSPYGANIETAALQQFTINMFADMGIQPQVADAFLASQGLVRASASNDHIAPVATLDDLPDTVGAYSTVTITGTANDIDNDPSNDDGKVAVVEVSTDDGQTWRVAEGTSDWSFSWTPTSQGAHTIRVRALDDSLNVLPTNQQATEIVTVGPAQAPDTVSLFGFSTPIGTLTNDAQPIELGLKFSASTVGQITALRYWRPMGDASDTDVRTGHLWSSAGQLLGTATFTSTPGQTGWQTASLATPVTLTAGETYVVSYGTANNYYSLPDYFTAGAVSEPFGLLSAPSSGASGGNGVYALGLGTFPTQSYQDANYWVDVVFDPSGSPTSPQVALTTASVAHAEGNSSVTTFDYVVTRSGNITGASTVSWAVAGSGADPANIADFQGGVLPSGTVAFAAGETSKTITVNVLGDAAAEADEGFTLTLSNASGATLGTSTASGTIVNDDFSGSPTATTLFGPTAPFGTLYNDNSPVELGMKFTAASAGQITALRYYRVAADADDTDVREGHIWTSTGQLLGTATFTSTAGQYGWQVATLATPVTLAAGTTYVVSYKTEDTYVAAPGYFTSSVTDATGQLTALSAASSGGNGVFTYGPSLTFPDESANATNYWVDLVFTPNGAADSPQVGFSTISVSHAEGDSGLVAFDYVLTRTGGSSETSTVSWAVAGSGADAASAADFQGGVLPTGTVTFAPGETSKTITVSVVGDTTVEPDESFTVTLSNPSGATLGTAVAGGTITNDETLTGAQIALATAGASHAEGAGGLTTFDYVVTRSGDATVISTVNWAVAGSGANPADAADFQNGQLPSGALTFAPGETSKTITVSVLGDATAEHDEDFTLTLSDAAGATLGTATASGTIVNDDGAPPVTTSLFGTTQATGVLGYDNQPLEVGMKFTAAAAGQITALRYYRAAADANDTDIREGHLWSSTGQLLGTATFTSAAGQSGWQVATLSTPIDLTAGVTYVVSYRTADNYFVAPNYFTSSVTDATGQLTAPSSASSGGNGVFIYGSASGFPDQTHNASNYWVDVVFAPESTPAPPPAGASLFGATTATGVLGNDGQAVELGMKFSASAAGRITALRYWRDAGDAGDTDVREGHLWSSAGQLLGTVTFTSTAGQSGWQTADLAAPIELTAGATYVVSYKTANNYIAQTNYFTSTITDTTGQLTAPSSAAGGGNGVYVYGSSLQFPDETYSASNYWVDVVYSPPGQTLAGTSNPDTLGGGAGADTLAGAAGADVFRWSAFSESATTSPDVILDFEGAGVAGGDLIDVSALPGTFAFVGTAAFVGGGLPSIRYVVGDGVTDIEFDDGGGLTPEMVVRLGSVVTLTSGDFVL